MGNTIYELQRALKSIRGPYKVQPTEEKLTRGKVSQKLPGALIIRSSVYCIIDGTYVKERKELFSK